MATVIFDFDGTLADMKQLLMEIGNGFAVEKGWKPIDEVTYQKLSQGSIKEGMKVLGISLRDIPFLLIEGRRRLNDRIDDIKLFAGIKELTDQLVADGHELYVLSTNSHKLIKQVLVNYGVEQNMTVLPSSGLFGKAPALKRFMRSRRLKPDQVWMIGDELRDLEASLRVGIHHISVLWGLQHPDALRAANPEYLAETPQDIFTCISQAS